MKQEQRKHGPLLKLEVGTDAIKELEPSGNLSHPPCALCCNQKAEKSIVDSVIIDGLTIIFKSYLTISEVKYLLYVIYIPIILNL